MGKNVLHKRSVVVENGQPKLPTSAQTEYGEIAINYAAGYETLSIRNSANEIVPFSSDSQINAKLNTKISGITMNNTALTVSGGVVDLGVVLTDVEERVIAEAFNDLNDKIAAISGETQNSVTGITMNETTFTVSGGVIDLGEVMTDENDYVISTALNDLNDRLSNLESNMTPVKVVNSVSQMTDENTVYILI